MAMGSNSPFWSYMETLFPVLGFSRWPVSDYRIFIAIPIMIFAIVGLKAIIERQITVRTFAYRTSFILGWFSLGLFTLYSEISKPFKSPRAGGADLDIFSQQTIVAILILIASLSIFFYYLVISKNTKLSSYRKTISLSLIVLIVSVATIAIDEYRIIYNIASWKVIQLDFLYKEFGLSLENNGKSITYDIVKNLPTHREEREPPARGLESLRWKGYLTGMYLMTDEGSTRLVSRQTALNDNTYFQYMCQSWTPLLLEIPEEAHNNKKIFLPKTIFSEFQNIHDENLVTQTHYGINDITYKVSLDEPKLMVENEIYFPGWGATLIYPDSEVELEALVVNDVFRAWLLPAGDYEMKAHFEFPYFVIYQIISLSAFVVWLGIIVTFWLRSRNKLVV